MRSPLPPIERLPPALCVAVALLAGCAQTTAADYDAVAETAIRSIESGSPPLTYVLSDEIDPRARAAVAARRKVVQPADVPEHEGVALPGGYALLRSFLIAGDDATVSARVGSDHRGPFACGPSIELRLKSRPNGWTVDDRGELVC
jgi:hypothetical protein